MFYIFELFISSHPDILMFVYTCLYPRILTSLYLQVHTPLLPYLHPHMLRFMCDCLYPCILTCSYPQVHVCLLVSSNPHILASSGFRVLASMLTLSGQCVLDTNEQLHSRIFKFISSR